MKPTKSYASRLVSNTARLNTFNLMEKKIIWDFIIQFLTAFGISTMSKNSLRTLWKRNGKILAFFSFRFYR